ncbi:TPA: tyrosine-type recombinase/integrase [Escherichia coli]
MLNSRTYLYQRNGVFYIRLRMKTTGRLTASLPSHNRYKLASVSLRTKDRRTAMAHSRHIKSALKAIHADNPSASYEELREHLKTIVEWELGVSRDDLNAPESYQLYVDQYDDIKSNLREAVATERLTVDQHRYINDVIGVLKACQDRLKGDSSGLLSYLEPETGSLRPSVSLSVLAEPEVPEPKALTLASLIEQYEQENAHSDRCVPLVDGAYGFVLSDFMSLVEDRRKAKGDNAMVFDGLKLMKNGYGEQVSKWFNRTLLPKVLADRSGLAFHSFRHTVATQLKQHGVELAYAQAIMGHSSGSITYDRYAKEVEVDRLVNVMADVYKETLVNGDTIHCTSVSRRGI